MYITIHTNNTNIKDKIVNANKNHQITLKQFQKFIKKIIMIFLGRHAFLSLKFLMQSLNFYNCK